VAPKTSSSWLPQSLPYRSLSAFWAERITRSTQSPLLRSRQTAVQQIEIAVMIMRDGGNAFAATYYEAQLPKARSLLDQLTSRSR
jgi:hypothetical protein